MDDIIKIVKSPEESSLLIKGVGKTIKTKSKEQIDFFVLLGTSGATLLRNLLTGKRVKAKIFGRRTIKAKSSN